MEQMIEEQLLRQERQNTGTAWTHNKYFDRNGYLVVENLYDPIELYHPIPKERGQMNWWGKHINQYNHNPEEGQVEGSLARYSHPMYRDAHTEIRLRIEKIIGRKLYNTYYYDRFYFPGQKLERHLDRDACEISVTLHISTNLEEPWPIWIKTPDRYTKNNKEILVSDEEKCVILKPGDAMLYKGCERPHWRNEMPGESEDLYYHQIFFHYVLQDGQRAHCAWDMSK